MISVPTTSLPLRTLGLSDRGLLLGDVEAQIEGRRAQDGEAAPLQPEPVYQPEPSFQPEPAPAPVQQDGDSDQIFAALEKLGSLRDMGILSEDEFAAKKAELLSRL